MKRKFPDHDSAPLAIRELVRTRLHIPTGRPVRVHFNIVEGMLIYRLCGARHARVLLSSGTGREQLLNYGAKFFKRSNCISARNRLAIGSCYYLAHRNFSYLPAPLP
jgi:hypothetical protein